MKPSRAALALGAVLAVALALRLWGLRYGLPWLFYFHDEPQVVLRALRFGTGDFNPHFFIWPGTLLLYGAFLAYGGWFATGRLAGWWSGKAGFAAAHFRDPSAFYLLARLESVAFGVWGVWLAARLGAAAYSAPVGLAAAAGLAINAMHGHYAHLAHPVTWMTAFTLLGLWAACRVATTGTGRDLVIAAVAIGLGVACQYHAALLVVPVGVAVLLRAAREPARRAAWLGRGVLVGLGGVLLYLVVSPYSVLDFATFRGDLAWLSAKAGGELAGSTRDPLTQLAEFVRGCVVPGLGLPLALMGAAGVLRALARRSASDLVVLSFVVAYLLLASRAAIFNDRYVVPLVVPALLLAARAIEEGLATLRAPAQAQAWAVPLAAVLLCAPSALQLVETDLAMTREDTRAEALRWFEANVPADSRVVLDMLKFWNTQTAPLAENRARVLEHLDAIAHGISGGGHSAVYADYYRYQLEHPRAPAYYLRGTDVGNAVEPLASYRREGFEWAMVSDLGIASAEGRAERGDSSAAAFYRALPREGRLMAEFHPERWRRLGPRIWIYRIAGSEVRP
jgi:hypothetical protein